MSSQEINKELSKLEPSALIELYVFDGTVLGLTPPLLRFYAGTNAMKTPLIFDGNEYTPFPVEFTGFEYDGKGSLPRPKARLANINGFFSSYVLQYNNLIGAKLTRIKTFARFLDAVNFEGGVNPYGSSGAQTIQEDDFYIFQKTAENNDVIEFELTTKLELNNVKIPKRQMFANYCPAIYRRGDICPYASIPVADKNNKPFLNSQAISGETTYGLSSLTPASPLQWSATSYSAGTYVVMLSLAEENFGEKIFFVAVQNTSSADVPGRSPKWVADACSRSHRGCKLRFPTGSLPFGGFPGISRFPFN